MVEFMSRLYLFFGFNLKTSSISVRKKDHIIEFEKYTIL